MSLRYVVRHALVPAFAALFLAIPSAVAQQDGPSELNVAVTDEGLEAPETLEHGFYTLAVDDRSSESEAEVEVTRLNEGVEPQAVLDAYEALQAAFMEGGDVGAAIEHLASLGAAVTGSGFPPAVTELTPGEYLVVDSMDPSKHATFTVAEAARAPTPPEADLTVDMMDFAFSVPDELPAGPQTWEVRNVGEQVHHMVLIRMNEGATLDDVMTFVETEEGPPPGEEAGYVAILSPGVSNYVQHDLAPGRYVALCFLPDYETGTPHVMLGMVAEFVVAGDGATAGD